MKKILFFALIASCCLGSVTVASVRDDIDKHASCALCNMDRGKYAMSRMLIEYNDKSSTATCSIHCTALQMAGHREKTITSVLVADYASKQLINARDAFWVLGGKKKGVMTKQAKWAFAEKEKAEKFIRQQGGKLASFDDAMAATFSDMYDDIRMHQKTTKVGTALTDGHDIQAHPECRYCGMNRQRYDFSRMLVEYADGTVTGTCSIHCTGLDFGLNPGKKVKAVMVGDYETKKLIEARNAFWIVGGNLHGVMSIRGKWAFESKENAEVFMKENGGKAQTFDQAMKAAFEDMWEIIR